MGQLFKRERGVFYDEAGEMFKRNKTARFKFFSTLSSGRQVIKQGVM